MEKLIYRVEIDEEGEFIERPNRFVGYCRLDGGENIIAHVHDSARMRELLYRGNRVFLRRAGSMEKRKTQWDLISAVADDGEEILTNSSIHRYITDNLFRDFEISPFGEVESIKAEVKYGDSRLDYLLEKDGEKIYIETKGVTLSENKEASFPGAPSTRAVKHVKELMELKKEGYRAAILFMVFRNSDTFRANGEIDPDFEKIFYEALSQGVEVYLLQFKMVGENIYYTDKEIKLLEKK